MVTCTCCGTETSREFAYVDPISKEVICDSCNGALDNLLDHSSRKVHINVVGTTLKLPVYLSQPLASSD